MRLTLEVFGRVLQLSYGKEYVEEEEAAEVTPSEFGTAVAAIVEVASQFADNHAADCRFGFQPHGH
jgi:hypothetical protein